MDFDSFINVDRGNRLQPSRASRVYWHLRSLAEAYHQVVERFFDSTDDLKVLDYGCGSMPYRSLFSGPNIEYIGADLPGNQMADIRLDESGDLPGDLSGVDVILSSQTLEHVTSPEVYLSECHRVLGSDALLVLSTHGVWRFHPDPGDYWRWTSMGLRKIVEDHGFEIIWWQGVLGIPAVSVQLLQDYVIDRFPRWMQPVVSIPCQTLMFLLDRMTSQSSIDRDGSVYVVVARKRST